MTRNRHRPRAASGQRRAGQSSVEYLIACAVAMAIVALPVDGHASAFAAVFEAIRTALARLVVAIARPL